MRKPWLLVLMLLLLTTPAFSDSAPMQVAQGGTVKPFNNQDIILRDEVIDMQLYKNYCLVTVNYTFVNTGPAQEVLMGFPNFPYWKDEYFDLPIKDFQAYDGNQKLKITHYDEASNNPVEQKKKSYECFFISFKAGEMKRVKNTYRQEYQTLYKVNQLAIKYILSTGSLWKGVISSVKVNIAFNGFPPPEFLGRTIYMDKREFNDDGKRQIPGVEIKPGQWLIDGNRYSTEFINIEPNFEIEISLPGFLVDSIKASSELKSSNQSYNAWNVYDNNPATAWVEGVAGPGIGQTLFFDMNPWYYEASGAYLIEKIGIINGYGRTPELFQANNRIKRLRITSVAKFATYNYELDRSSLEFLLADMMEIQYIRFPKPLLMNEFTLTILEVYPGTKYDDTCISEVHIFPMR